MAGRGVVRPILSTAICFIMAVIAWGTVFYGHSVYMDALMRAHGWSSSLISNAILVFWIASLPGTLSVGILIDRMGPAPVVAMGGLCIGGGLCLLGQISEPWHLFLIYAAMGFGYPALAGAAISATMAPWFDRGFGVSLGIALTGASVGGALLPPIIVHNSARYGFETTMPLIGGIVLAVILAAVLLLIAIGRPGNRNTDQAQTTQYSMLAIIGGFKFWAIAIPAAFGLGGQVGLLAHQVPIVAAQTETVTAALTVTVVAIASAIGRLLIGLLSRSFSVITLAAMTYALHGVGICLLAIAQTAPEPLTWIIAGCAVSGLTVGAIVMLPPLIVRHVYGPIGFGRTYAMVNVVMYVLAGLSPWLVGMLRDQTGAYTSALWLLVAMEIVAFVLILGGIRRLGQSQAS